MNTHGLDELFERRIAYPDPDARARFARLVGLDDQKARLTKILGILVNPMRLRTWAKTHYADAEGVLHWVLHRPPLVVLAGDVGSGKTELAETVGDAVAREEKIDVMLFPLSLAARGKGLVGDMTQQISAAFDHTIAEATKLKAASGRARGAVILLVDEADAIAQSREEAQMHHEDRAGVNTFIRGIDRIATRALPCAVVLCTNRPAALDPAVRRRAADILVFARPDPIQRRAVLVEPLEALGFSTTQIDAIVDATGPQPPRDYGTTFSDITQRLLPAIVLSAYPDGPVRATEAVEIARRLVPTAPFQERAS